MNLKKLVKSGVLTVCLLLFAYAVGMVLYALSVYLPAAIIENLEVFVVGGFIFFAMWIVIYIGYDLCFTKEVEE